MAKDLHIAKHDGMCLFLWLVLWTPPHHCSSVVGILKTVLTQRLKVTVLYEKLSNSLESVHICKHGVKCLSSARHKWCRTSSLPTNTISVISLVCLSDPPGLCLGMRGTQTTWKWWRQEVSFSLSSPVFIQTGSWWPYMVMLYWWGKGSLHC